MPTVQQHIEIGSDPDTVWALAGDPARIAEWLPAIDTSRVEGDRRSCTLVEGGQIEERILEHSDQERRYRYEILEGPMPVSAYTSTFQLQDRDGHSHVTWTAEFRQKKRHKSKSSSRPLNSSTAEGSRASRTRRRAPRDPGGPIAPSRCAASCG